MHGSKRLTVSIYDSVSVTTDGGTRELNTRCISERKRIIYTDCKTRYMLVKEI